MTTDTQRGGMASSPGGLAPGERNPVKLLISGNADVIEAARFQRKNRYLTPQI